MKDLGGGTSWMAEAWFRRFTANSYGRTVQSQPVRAACHAASSWPSQCSHQLPDFPRPPLPTAHPGLVMESAPLIIVLKPLLLASRFAHLVRTQGKDAGAVLLGWVPRRFLYIHQDDCHVILLTVPLLAFLYVRMSRVVPGHRAGPLNTPCSALVPAENTLPCSSWAFFGHLGRGS